MMQDQEFKVFLNWKQKAQSITGKNDKFGYIKTKILCSAKDPVSRFNDEYQLEEQCCKLCFQQKTYMQNI